jgi:hypothetical protein
MHTRRSFKTGGLILLFVLSLTYLNGRSDQEEADYYVSKNSPDSQLVKAFSLLNRMLENTNGEAEIVHVTNLNKSGPGSFEAAVTGGSSDITRIVVFDVSGECALNRKKGDVRERITINRENLWIAGQTAPDPGDGTGRGFTLKGGLKFLRGFVVVEHIRVQRIDGHPDPDNIKYDGRGIAVFPNPRDSRLGKNEFFLFRNVTVRWTQDVSMGVGAQQKDGEYSYPENIVIDNCMFAEPLNRNMDLNKGEYINGWNRGLNLSEGTRRGLIRGSLHASAIVRTPQITQGSTGLVVNNFTFNYGSNVPGSAGMQWLYPMHLNPKNPDNVYHKDHTGPLLVGVASNYAEAGNKTRLPGPPFTYTGSKSIDSNGSPGYLGPNQWWDDGKNRVISYYDPTTAPMSTAPNEFNPNLAETPFYDTTAGAPDSEYIEIVSDPPFPLPGIVLSAIEAKEHCLTYAGAWPGDRDAVDARIIREVREKTHSPAPRSEIDYIPVSTVTNTPPSIPDEPGDGQLPAFSPLFRKEANGLTVLENWLNTQHINAGGCSTTVYLAAEWLTYQTGLQIDQTKLGQFVVYPNPTNGLVNIESDLGKINAIEINVFDIKGNRIMSKPYSSGDRMTFSLEANPPGMYFTEIRVNGKQILKKVILN